MPKIKGTKTVVEEHEIEISVDELLNAIRAHFYGEVKIPTNAYINSNGKWVRYIEHSYNPFQEIRDATEEEKLIEQSIETLRLIHKL